MHWKGGHTGQATEEDIVIISPNFPLWLQPFEVVVGSLLSLLRTEITGVSHHTQSWHNHFLKNILSQFHTRSVL